MPNQGYFAMGCATEPPRVLDDPEDVAKKDRTGPIVSELPGFTTFPNYSEDTC